MGFTYPGKFTYLNTFMMQVAQRCSDNRGPTVIRYSDFKVCPQKRKRVLPS